METFKAIVVEEKNDNIEFSLKETALDQLSEGEVVIKVHYSSVNYKDMLAVQKKGGVIRNYPMIPGIDLSGTVISSADKRFKEGDEVIVTGFDMGMTHTGGFSEVARVKADWIVKLPHNLSLKEAMIFGTAGFTAALSIAELEKNGMKPENNPRLLVTGATGGVGSIALQILKKTGYNNITALIRKDYQHHIALELGATKTFHVDELGDGAKPLAKQNFDYVLDTVGGDVASKLISQISYRGCMSLCGNAGGIKIDTTVLPLILRGVKLLGIDSVNVPPLERPELWEKMAKEWNVTQSVRMNEITLEQLPEIISKLKEGTHIGRTIIKIA
ncbi:YhdH/YhfP family quinone oxidoreductase [Lacrimispora sp.]|uniref:YhdH/YhfP family quinone oxidoreductase n=1 Tax=Lacrimispora sp. TaxID=2719234 RepID=UPI002FDB5B19